MISKINLRIIENIILDVLYIYSNKSFSLSVFVSDGKIYHVYKAENLDE